MDIFKIKGVHIDGVSACVPQNKVENDVALREMYGDEAKLIMESTGIRSRCLIEPGTTSSDMCIAAAQDVLKYRQIYPKNSCRQSYSL